MAATRAGSGGQRPRRGFRVALVMTTFRCPRGIRRVITPGLAAASGDMDETPPPPDHDEQERIHREADAIDVNQYRKRSRALKAIGLGAALAGAVWLVLIMLDSRRNPCQRVRDHFCKADPAGPQCQSYD